LSNLGDKLKREREARGVSLQEISAATRVNIKFLEALEKNDYSEYQAPVFITGFLRSYANHLGLDSDRIVAEYEALNLEVRHDASRVIQISDEQKPFPVGLAVVVAVVLLVLFGIFSSMSGDSNTADAPQVKVEKPSEEKPVEVVEDEVKAEKKPAPEEVKKETKKEKAPEPAPKPKKETPAPAPVVAPTPANRVEGNTRESVPVAAKYRLAISVEEEEAWVLVVIDEEDVRDMFVRPGQKIILNGEKSFLFTTGNATSVRLELNGKPLDVKIPKNNVIKNWQIPLPLSD